MSEPEKPSGLSTGAWIAIAVVGVIVGGGCLVSCMGLVGFGLMVPSVRQAQQAVEAEAARQDAENAAERVRAEAEAAAEKAKQPDKGDARPTEPESDPANQKPDEQGQREENEKA